MDTQPILNGLYAITPDGLSQNELLQKVEAALKGGVAICQYRDKKNKAAEKKRRAQSLKKLCQNYRVPLIINDDPALANAIKAAGVHLGQNDQSIQSARRMLGHQAIIGLSCYDRFELAQQAYQQGADYIAFGACFDSKTKPEAKRADLELFRRAKKELGLPTVAIGGIRLDNVSQVIAAGADMVAVIQSLFNASDISATARQFNSFLRCL